MIGIAVVSGIVTGLLAAALAALFSASWGVVLPVYVLAGAVGCVLAGYVLPRVAAWRADWVSRIATWTNMRT